MRNNNKNFFQIVYCEDENYDERRVISCWRTAASLLKEMSRVTKHGDFNDLFPFLSIFAFLIFS
jgi:hypothetical protein